MSHTIDNTRPIKSSLVILFGAILLPYGYEQTIGLGSANHIIRWVFWTFTSSFYHTGLSLTGIQNLLNYAIFWMPRLLIVIWIFMYYSGKSSKRQTIAMTIISIMPGILLSLYSIILESLQPSGFSIYVIPIPSLFILVLLLLQIRPYHDSDEPWYES